MKSFPCEIHKGNKETAFGTSVNSPFHLTLVPVEISIL